MTIGRLRSSLPGIDKAIVISNGNDVDCSKLKANLGWAPRWNIEKAVEKTVEWTKCWASGGDVRACMDIQIEEFLCSQQERAE